MDPAGLGYGPELVHVWFGTLNLPGGAMSSRSGNIIRLAEFMDEGVRRARAVVDEKSPQLSDAERARVAEAVGCGAIRYADESEPPIRCELRLRPNAVLRGAIRRLI